MHGSNVTARLLTRAQAASYCGISVSTFDAVRAISLGNSKRLERFDKKELDLWIDRLRGKTDSQHQNWLAKWQAGDDPRSR